MLTRISNSWRLIKASAAVLQADKELIVFPIVSAIGLVVVTISFAFPMFLSGLFDSVLEGRLQIFGFILVFAFYMVQYFVIIFANSALVGAAMIRLRGGDPTVADGFGIALKRIGQIFGFAVASATVGMILRWLSERDNFLGRIAASIFGLAWNLATYLVVPILVVEGVGPIEAIKKSANLLKKTWGEQIVGNFGIGIIFGLLTFLLFLIGIPVIILAVRAGSVAAAMMVVFVFILTLIFMGLINSTLSGIYVAAVYRYAAEGEVGSFFSEDMVREAFRLKSRR